MTSSEMQKKEEEIAKLKLINGQLQTNILMSDIKQTFSRLYDDIASKLTSSSNLSALGLPFTDLLKQLSSSDELTGADKERLEKKMQEVRKLCEKTNDQVEAGLKEMQNRLKQVEQHVKVEEPTQGTSVTSKLLVEEKQQIAQLASPMQLPILGLADQDHQTLVGELQKVTMMNESWQKYDGEREGYVKQLQSQLRQITQQRDDTIDEKMILTKELQKVVGINLTWQKYSAEREASFKQKQIRLMELEQQMKEPMRGAGATGDLEIGRAEVENMKLKADLSMAKTENDLLRDEIQMRTTRGDTETVSVLEQQVEILVEDFRLERADRERAQALIAEQREELELTKRQLQQYQLELPEATHQRRAEVPAEVPRPENDHQHQMQLHRGNHYGDLGVDSVRDVNVVMPRRGDMPDRGLDAAGPAYLLQCCRRDESQHLTFTGFRSSSSNRERASLV